ncbi:unnamed protein product [Amoebophrya sp. A120]|nr:unnamed protein product [Amoebophrya sp. A120]|eukprot:GSA120T00007051001.1
MFETVKTAVKVFLDNPKLVLERIYTTGAGISVLSADGKTKTYASYAAMLTAIACATLAIPVLWYVGRKKVLELFYHDQEVLEEIAAAVDEDDDEPAAASAPKSMKKAAVFNEKSRVNEEGKDTCSASTWEIGRENESRQIPRGKNENDEKKVIFDRDRVNSTLFLVMQDPCKPDFCHAPGQRKL